MPYATKEKRAEYDRKRRMMRAAGATGGTKIKRNTAPHVALLFMKMMKRPIRPRDLINLNEKMFGKRVYEVLAVLVDRGLAVQRDDKTYEITDSGITEVFSLAGKER